MGSRVSARYNNNIRVAHGLHTLYYGPQHVEPFKRRNLFSQVCTTNRIKMSHGKVIKRDENTYCYIWTGPEPFDSVRRRRHSECRFSAWLYNILISEQQFRDIDVCCCTPQHLSPSVRPSSFRLQIKILFNSDYDRVYRVGHFQVELIAKVDTSNDDNRIAFLWPIKLKMFQNCVHRSMRLLKTNGFKTTRPRVV